MSSHPLMEIRFQQDLYGDPDERIEVIRHLYHIPRQGDLISLDAIQGKVRTVTWMEDYVIVKLQGKSA